MKLAELQSAFQAAVLAGDAKGAEILDAFAAPSRADRAEAFDVYVHGYRLRLAEYLEEDYPALRALIGETAFARLVSAYIAANPSRNRSARYYSCKMPEFLAAHPLRRANAWALGLARLERALADAFDAKDVAAKDLETLAAFAPEEWPLLVFEFHPSLSLIVVAADTTVVYAALVDEEKPTLPAPRAGEETIAVWRAEYEPLYRALEEDERLALNEALAGKSFGDICQLVAFQDETAPAAERLAQFLVNWFSEGLIVGVREAAE